MEHNMMLRQIGVVRSDDEGFRLQVAPDCRGALLGLDGFSHLNIFWWFSGCESASDRQLLTVEQPYTNGPERLGVLATRSPQRPNPIALSCCGVTYVDSQNGVIGLDYIDAYDQSPLLDVKPYVPSVDRVASPQVPAWCAHWPDCVERSGEFAWDSEFNH